MSEIKIVSRVKIHQWKLKIPRDLKKVPSLYIRAPWKGVKMEEKKKNLQRNKRKALEKKRMKNWVRTNGEREAVMEGLVGLN